ncbi:MAG: hypothetical protein HOC91_04385 [Nitrospinaceae bacterium]|jgi:D-proline reductase (dithiol) PrdB|nr:hypothetical protein [Nitrospinaceae bacterium]MBT3433849.1 hypothetical protein [Nitrospinaceae bacterium]MBT3821990.1 hypothetical protein [Nitrospinaceae bacterium]MBT4095733.1 hypothetical protein [Nitrospinaceae bacterium]MBT4429732.1 hypothetical protein [Nitrospinaceae bacterium]
MSLREVKDKLIARLLTRYPALVRRWAGGREFVSRAGEENPWTPLTKPLDECRVALVTTGGLHLKSQLPFDMKNPDGDPTFREIPSSVPRGEITITHNYYDHRSADRDINVVFPLDRLADLAAEGLIAGVVPFHLSFMGHIDGPLIEKLIDEEAPEAARRLMEAGADCVLLTPA